MTREERELAIDIFEDNFTVIDTHGHYTEEEECLAIDMAIEALEQEPSREFEDYENEIEDLHNRLDIAEYDKERLREEVTNLEAKIKALKQEPFDIETYCKEHFCVMVDKDVWEKAEKALKQEPILDKIRAEIEALIDWHDCPIEYDNGNDVWYCEACNQAIRIIDKYRGES